MSVKYSLSLQVYMNPPLCQGRQGQGHNTHMNCIRILELTDIEIVAFRSKLLSAYCCEVSKATISELLRFEVTNNIP